VILQVCTDCLMGYCNGYEYLDGEWYIDGSDTPCEHRPLGLVVESLLSLTDSESGFSWSSCDGCGSGKGGDRHEMVYGRG